MTDRMTGHIDHRARRGHGTGEADERPPGAFTDHEHGGMRIYCHAEAGAWP
ncbi:MAG: hypothetical protein ACFBSD_12860 [Paracoccaceae bacterium]